MPKTEAEIGEDVVQQATGDVEAGYYNQDQQYSFRDSSGKELSITNEEIEQNKKYIAHSEAIILTEEETSMFIGSDFVTKADNYFEKIGRKAINPVIGTVMLQKSGLRHIVYRGDLDIDKAKVVPAIKRIIQTGKIVSVDENHNGKPVDTVCIAGKVKTVEGTYYVGVVVSQHNGGTRGQQNHYTFHQVQIQAEKNTTQEGSVSQKASVTSAGGVSLSNVLKEIASVNDKKDNSVSSIKEDGSIGGYSREYVDNFVNAYVNGGMDAVRQMLNPVQNTDNALQSQQCAPSSSGGGVVTEEKRPICTMPVVGQKSIRTGCPLSVYSNHHMFYMAVLHWTAVFFSCCKQLYLH